MKLEPNCVTGITEHMLPKKLNTGVHWMCERLSNEITHQMDAVLIEGLKRKGFDFTGKPRHEVEEFVKACCRCEDNIHHKERVYYVFDKPFLLYDYSIEMDLKWEHTERTTTVSAEAGSYRFI